MGKQLTPQGHDFSQIISIIEEARSRALRAVNAELIQMYWNVGGYLSNLCANATFGDKVIDEVASYIASSGTETGIEEYPAGCARQHFRHLCLGIS